MNVQRADPQARNRALVVLLLALLVGALAFVLVNRWMTGALALEPHESRRTLATALRWATVGLSVLVIAFGAYLFALGRNIVRSERFPPPGATVIRDTKVLEGGRARTRGLQIQAVSALLIVLALALPLAAFQVAARLG